MRTLEELLHEQPFPKILGKHDTIVKSLYDDLKAIWLVQDNKPLFPYLVHTAIFNTGRYSGEVDIAGIRDDGWVFVWEIKSTKTPSSYKKACEQLLNFKKMVKQYTDHSKVEPFYVYGLKDSNSYVQQYIHV